MKFFVLVYTGNIIYMYYNVLTGLFQYGEIEEMNVCDNMGDHLVGNVYVKVRKPVN